MQSDIHRYRLAYGKGAAMKLHHISVIAAALVICAAVTGAPAQQQIIQVRWRPAWPASAIPNCR